mgnify:FL=1
MDNIQELLNKIDVNMKYYEKETSYTHKSLCIRDSIEYAKQIISELVKIQEKENLHN